MKSKLHLPLLCGIAIGTSAIGGPQPGQTLEERSRLVGTWRGKMAHESEPSLEIVITPEKISGRSLRGGEDLGEGTYEIDPERKTLDAHGIKDPVSGKTYLGIYSLEGDTLKWCSNSGSDQRPKDFSISPNGSHFVMVLQRQKEIQSR
jgi:uncharacterized protein (TIGR03067 family)